MDHLNQQQRHGSNARSPFFTEEHEMLRDQVRRFVDEEVKPFADAWETQGFVPREVLRRMGSLGFFGIRYPEVYGGAEMDTLGSVVFAEELGRSTFSGVAITALVLTACGSNNDSSSSSSNAVHGARASACENRSIATQRGSVVPSHSTRISDGPAIMSMPTVPNTRRLAAAT